ncbi:VWA domain-containing protein [Pseudomonas sp. RIT-PI-AD]|uniref:vWA domain-containing protein n=1 Tax=Pseudomonas sp. RIT-PI-AD TaxID=3035294 RepID=UPI0021D992E0|nr:VWA domain-containing protein [Pseudomonas sp. RIT-PI-AD]
MAKKDLSIRSAPLAGADARQRPGENQGGTQGARSGVGLRGRIDWPATLAGGRPRQRSDLIRSPRRADSPALWVVILDASASTGRHGALGRAKALLSGLFEQAYRQRVRLAVLQAGGRDARWSWLDRPASARLQAWLIRLGAGGGTPLEDALRQAHDWLVRRQRQRPTERQRLLIFTDGRLRHLPAQLIPCCPSLLIDIESGPIRLGRGRLLAERLGAEYRSLD